MWLLCCYGIMGSCEDLTMSALLASPVLMVRSIILPRAPLLTTSSFADSVMVALSASFSSVILSIWAISAIPLLFIAGRATFFIIGFRSSQHISLSGESRALAVAVFAKTTMSMADIRAIEIMVLFFIFYHFMF